MSLRSTSNSMIAALTSARLYLDYHVDIDKHYYSVPYRFAREQVEARITANTIEIFHKGERIAAHRRSSGNGKHTTTPEHMPSSHRRFADWTIERISREASAIGPDVALLCERILADRPHPEQGYRACLGIIRLVKAFERERVNAACGRALEIGARTYGSVRSHSRQSSRPTVGVIEPSITRADQPLQHPRYDRLTTITASRTPASRGRDHPGIRGRNHLGTKGRLHRNRQFRQSSLSPAIKSRNLEVADGRERIAFPQSLHEVDYVMAEVLVKDPCKAFV